MPAKKADPDSGSGGKASERGRLVAGVAIAAVLLVAVLAMLMGCLLLLLWFGVPLWPALVVLVVLCGVAVAVVRRVTAPAAGQGHEGWVGRLLKVAIMSGIGFGPGQ